MTIKWLALVGLALTACTDDSGPAGDGDDTLPKKGEVATDPTIVSATATCSFGGDDGTPGGTPTHIAVKVAGSDPAGQPNLGSCAATINNLTDQDSFGVNTNCYLYLNMGKCTGGENVTVGITVANDTGGVTTASVKLTVAALPN